MVPRGQTQKDALFAVALELFYSRKYSIVDRVRNVLLAAEVSFRGLDRGVPEQKLYLFEIPSRPPAQFRARATEIMGRQALDACTVRVMQHDFPNRSCAQRGARHLAILSDRPKHFLLGDFSRDGPEIETLFHPGRDRDQANAIALAD